MNNNTGTIAMGNADAYPSIPATVITTMLGKWLQEDESNTTLRPRLRARARVGDEDDARDRCSRHRTKDHTSIFSAARACTLSSFDLPRAETWEGARPRTQLLDVPHGIALRVERTLHDHGFGGEESAAQMSNNTAITSTLPGNLRQCGPDYAVAKAMLRPQSCPLGNHMWTESIAFTGSSIAAAVGRNPVLDVMHEDVPKMWTRGLQVDQNRTLCIAAYYVVSLYSIAHIGIAAGSRMR